MITGKSGSGINFKPIQKQRFKALLAAEFFLGSVGAAYAFGPDGAGAGGQAHNAFVAGQHFSSTLQNGWHTQSTHSAVGGVHTASTQPLLSLGSSVHSLASVQHALTSSFNAASVVPHQSPLSASSGGVKLGGQGVALDLSSTTANIVLGTSLFVGRASVTINVGGVAKEYKAGQQVTAAEYVAIREVISGAGQTIDLNVSGAASGGSFNLNAIGTKTTELLVPSGVTAVDYVSSNKNLSINGELLNYGSIYAVSTNSQILSGTISGKDIVNENGGLISTQLPSGLALSVAGAVSGLDLTLAASNSITNSGIISGTGSLNLIAGSGNFNNAGLIKSDAGNVNFGALASATSINISNNGGTVSAVAGNINVRDASYNGTGNIALNGGNYLSQNLNLNSGTGAITGSIGTVSGNLNTSADAAHVYTDTTTLKLGNNSINGDPLFVNTGGNIEITGSVDVSATNQPLAVIASGNIFAAPADTGAQLIDHGGAITLIAGADITGYTGTNISTTLPPGTAANGAVTIDLSKSSATGGNIDLSQSTQTTIIDSSSTSGNGGSVTMVALTNGSAGGQILLPGSSSSTSINTSSSTGSGGNVMVMADSAAGGTVVRLANVIAGGQTQGGNVGIYTQAPAASTVQIDQTGTVTSGSIANSGVHIANAVVSTGDVVTSGGGGASQDQANGANSGSAGTISIAGGSVQVNGSLLAYGGGGGGGAGQTAALAFNGGNAGNGAAINVQSDSNLTVLGDVNASGGGGGGGGGGAFGTAGGLGGSGGSAGSVTLSATSSLMTTGSVLAADGGSGGAGGASSANVSGGGGAGGGAFGGAGGGGGGGIGFTNGVGGGGGGGYYNSGAIAAYDSASGGGGAGGAVTRNNGGYGGGFAGVGAGGTSNDVLSTYGQNGGAGVGGNGGNYSGSGFTAGLGGSAAGFGGTGGGGSASGTAGGNVSLASGTNGTIQMTGKEISDIAGPSSLIYGGQVTVQGGAFAGDVLQLVSALTASTSLTLSGYTVSVSPSSGVVQTPVLVATAGGIIGLFQLQGTNHSPVAITANAPSGVTLVTIGDVLLTSSNGAKNGTFSLNADADSSGNASVTVNAGATVQAQTIVLDSHATTGSGNVQQMDPLTTQTLSAGTIQLSASNGNIAFGTTDGTSPVNLQVNASVNATIANMGSVLLATGSAGGNYQINTAVDANGNGQIVIASGATISAYTVNLTSTSSLTGLGGITQTDPITGAPSIIASSLNLTDTGSSTSAGAEDISLSIGGSQLRLNLATSGNANIYFPMASSSPSIGTIRADNLTIVSQGPINSGSDGIKVGGNLSLVAQTIVNNGTISAASMVLKGLDGLAFGVSNLGLIEAFGPSGNVVIDSGLNGSIYIASGLGEFGTIAVTGPGNPQILINAELSNSSNTSLVNFSGAQNLFGPTIINASGPNQSVTVANGTVAGNSLVWLDTPLYTQSAGGVIIGNPLVVGAAGQAGTIANSSGDVNLGTNLTFVGSSLAVLASGSINSTGLTAINLSGSFSGSLTMVAGYNFAPSTSGQVGPNSINYTISTPSAGGSINLTGVSINLSSSTALAAAGSLIAVAHGGSVSLGAIDASASNSGGIAGNITIIGQTGVSVGAITTTGGQPGVVNISAADSQTNGVTTIGNGILLSGGFVPVSGTNNGNIVLTGNLNAGASPISIITGGTGGISSLPGVLITTPSLIMTAGSGGIGTAGASISTTAPLLSANSIGNVFLSDSASAVNLLASSGSTFQLTTSAFGGTTLVSGPLAANNVTLQSTNNGNFILQAQVGGLNGGDSSSVTISANGLGAITDQVQGAPTVATASLTLSSGTGSIGALATPIKTDAATLNATTGNSTANGGVFIADSDTNPVTITGLAAGSNNSSIVFNGQASLLTISGQVSGNAVTINDLGSINVNNKIVGLGAVAVQAQGNLVTSNTVSGSSISLTTDAGSSGSISIGGKVTGTGAISILADGNVSTASSISGTSITVTNTGSSGSINIGGTMTGSMAVALTAEGTLQVNSPISGQTVQLQTASGSSGSITVGGPIQSSSSVTILSDNNIVTNGTISGTSITLTNTGSSGGTTVGGTISGTGAVAITAAGNIAVNSPVTGLTVALTTAAGTNGSIGINANLTATDKTATDTGISLTADGVGTISQTTGVIGSSGSSVDISSSSGSLGAAGDNLVVSAATVKANTTGNVFLSSVGASTTLDDSSGNIFQITALGNLTVGGTTGGLSANTVSLSTLNNGSLVIAGNINGLASLTTNATSVTLSVSGAGSITDTAQGNPTIATNTLSMFAFSGGIGLPAQALITNAASFTANTQGSVYVTDVNSGTVTLGASSGNNFVLTATNVAIGNNSTFAGTATFNSSNFTNPAGTIFTAGTMDINGPAAGALTINNGGTLVANASGGSINIASAADQNLLIGNNGGSTPGALQIGTNGSAINLTATSSSTASSNQVIFTGNENFIGNTVINANFPPADAQAVTVNTGVTVQGFNKVTVNSNTLNLFGTLLGNPLVFNSPTGFGTIANSQGNVLLTSNLIFHGQSLAIMAANNIIALNPITIDLSNSSSTVNGGNGGSLNIVAGFNFSPGTVGQVGPNGVVYQITQDPSSQGGSISMANVTVNVSSTLSGASAGNVLVAAHAGSINSGSIALGSITATGLSGTGIGGNVNITALGGITVGNIATSGGTAGNVTITAAAPQVTGTILVQNGNFTVGSIGPDITTLAGNISVNGINAGTGAVTLLTGTSGNIAVLSGASIDAGTASLTSGGGGGVTLGHNSTVDATNVTVSAGTGGISQLDATGGIVAGTLVLTSSGGDIGAKSQVLDLNTTNFTVNGAGNVYLADSVAANITIGSSSAGGTFQLESTTGNFTTATAVGAQVTAPNVSVTSDNGNIDVTIGTVNNLAFNAPNGTVTLGGTIVIGNEIVAVVPDASGNGGTITLNAASIAPPGGTTALTLDASAGPLSNGKGGTISINYTSSVAALNVPLTINANGAGSGNGGSVTYTSAAALASPLTINANATGASTGSGGTITYTSTAAASSPTGTALTLNANGVGNGSGGVINYSAAAALGSALTISADGAGTGSGGAISYASTATASSTAAATLQADALGQGNGGTITYVASAALGAALSLDANGAGSGNGGSVTYTSSNTGALSIGAPTGANLQISATGGSVGSAAGNGGSAIIQTGGDLTLLDPTYLNIGPLGSNGNGATLSLTCDTGTLTLGTSSLTFNGVGAGNGGVLSLSAPIIAYKNSGTLPLILSANGGTTGNGGVVSYITSNTTALTVGSTSNSISLSASSGKGGGNGGTVTVSTGGALTVNPGNITAGPLGSNGNGASINLLAGTVAANSPLVINATLSANGTGSGAGGSINLQSNSSTVFGIRPGQASSNGVNGTLTVAGGAGGNGTITVNNLAGGITVSTALQVVNNLTLDAGAGDITTLSNLGNTTTGSITLNASGNLIEQITGSLKPVLTAHNLTLVAQTGGIGTTKIPFRIAGSALTANGGGIVSISNSVKNISLGASSAGATGTFTLSTAGGITTTGDVTAGSVKMTAASGGNIALGGNIVAQAATGTVTLTTSGAGSIFDQFASGTDRITGSTILLNSGTGSIGTIGTSPVALRVNSANITPSTTGAVNIDDASSATLLVAGSKSTKQFLLSTDGSITVTKPITSATQVSLASAVGNIAIDANLGGSKTTIITLAAGGAGNISASSNKIILTASQSVTFNAGTGNIGSGTATTTAIATKSGIVSANTGGTGVVNLTDSVKATLVNSSSGGTFTLHGTNVLSVGNLSTTNGNILVATSGTTLSTVAGSIITANDGSLTINDSSTSGTINIAAGSTVQTAGLGGGSVQIGIGTLPLAQVAGTTPVNTTTTTSGGGKIFFGTNGITGPGAGTKAQVNALGQNVIFSTAKQKASHITLGNGAVVTADPPVSSSAQSVTTTAPVVLTGQSVVAGSAGASGASGAHLPTNSDSLAATSAGNPFSNTILPTASALNGTAADSLPALTGALLQGASVRPPAGVIDGVAEASWVSPTELTSGQIPAILVGDKDLSSVPATSMVVQLEDEVDLMPQASAVRKGNLPLVGCVSQNHGVGRSAHLTRGSVVFAPTVPTVVLTPFGSVNLAAGSLALVIVKGDSLAVFDLYDSHGGAVQIVSGERTIALSPGMHATIAGRAAKSYAEVNPAKIIAHRGLKCLDLGADSKAFVSEFCMEHALYSVTPIKALLQSKAPAAKKVAARLLKTAAIVNQINVGRGAYEHQLPPAVTAWLDR